jgi:hypothetical protein
VTGGSVCVVAATDIAITEDAIAAAGGTCSALAMAISVQLSLD